MFILRVFLQVPKISPWSQARCVGAFGCLDLIDPKTGEPLGDDVASCDCHSRSAGFERSIIDIFMNCMII